MIILKAEPKNLKEIVKRILKGETIVFPTDTVYGLVCDATNKKAVDKIFKIKKRDRIKSLPIFVKDFKIAKEIAQIDKDQEKFLKKSWPGKVTAVLKRKKSETKLYGIDSKTIALRIPNHKSLLNLVKQCNSPLVGTSANVSGLPDSGKIEEIIRQFQDQKIQPDIIVDAGNLLKSKASKIIDLTAFPFKILRP